MNPLKIFISATSGDLRGIRQIVKEALLTINCHPVEQTNFEPDARTVEDMLRGKIGDCQALIHICGMRYGAEPEVASLQPDTPRRSYTQWEYHIGRRLQEERGASRFRVYTFICPEDFPYDEEPDTEPNENRLLQLAHRSRLSDDPHLWEAPQGPQDIQLRVLALQEQVFALKQEQADVKAEIIRTRGHGLRIAAGIVLLLLGISWGIHHLITQNQNISSDVGQVHQDVSELKSIFSKERNFMALILARSNERTKEWENMPASRRFDLALDQIATEQKIPSKELRDLLDLYVQRVEADPDAEATDKYYVLMRKQAFDQAAQLAATEGQTAVARMKQQSSRKAAAKAIQENAAAQEKLERQRAIDFYHKEGVACSSAARFENALTAFRNAAALTDEISDPEAWFAEQNQIAMILLDLANYQDAEPLLNALLKSAEKLHGSDSVQSARVLNNLATLLVYTNRLAEAEPLMKRTLRIEEVAYGNDHPNVARDLNNFAQLLQTTGRLAEAEPLMRRALQIDEAAYGKNHPDVAMALNNLARLLQDTNRLAEAGPLMKRALEIDEASYGKDHPKIAIRLNNLATLLMEANRPTEAEPLMNRSLKIDETAYGKVHPSIARDLNNLAQLFQSTDRLAEAVPLAKRALEIDEASYGKDHPNVAIRLNNLANLLLEANRSAEAEPMSRQAVRIILRVQAQSGHRHPDVVTYVGCYFLIAREMKFSDDEIHTRLDAERQQAGLEPAAFESIWAEVVAKN